MKKNCVTLLIVVEYTHYALVNKSQTILENIFLYGVHGLKCYMLKSYFKIMDHYQKY